MREPLIGVINAGSSSLKFSFYEGEKRLLTGQVDGIGAHPSASATGPDGEALAPARSRCRNRPPSPSEVLPAILPWARERLGERRLAALGHRVVHGGLRHSRPARVTPELLAELEALVPLAPLHEPHNLAPIKMAHDSSIPNCRRSRASTPPFTAPRPRSSRPLRCPTRSTRKACDATAFMVSPTNTSPRYCRSRRPRLPMAGSSWRISAMAARPARSRRAFRSRRRWGSPRSTGCRWAPAAANSTPASCCT